MAGVSADRTTDAVAAEKNAVLKSGTGRPCAGGMMRPFGRGGNTWLKRAADAIDGESTRAGEMAARSFLRRQVGGIDVIGSEGERWALQGGGRGQDGEAHGFEEDGGRRLAGRLR